MTINNITGSPVEGANFYGREKELEYAWTHITKGNSLILSAPRRVGKTSFAKKLLEIAGKNNWNTLEINLEEVRSEEGFIKLFIDKLYEANWWQKTKKNTKQAVHDILQSIKLSFEMGDAKASLEWKIIKADVYNSLKRLIEHEKETLIMIDEITILLNSFIKNDKENGIRDVEYFLNWLRSFRMVTGTKIRWIFCSSIGIDNFTSINNLSYTLNDIDSLPIDEFGKEKAKDFIKQLSDSENIAFKENDITYMLDTLGWSLPYFIQILFSNINQLVKIQGKEISKGTIDLAYSMLINEKHLNTWDERLKEYGVYDPYARTILKHLCKIKEGESRDNLFNKLYSKIKNIEKTENYLNKLLYMLKNDGYITDTSDMKYKFRSPLLRDFWFNRFAK